MKKIFLLYSCLIVCGTTLKAQTKLYTEQYRPLFHFTPVSNWCNDPNGLVYNNGIYHLFYQHNPLGNQWGHMTWAHATSKDLVHWTHQPIAIPEENGIMIFSGTCVVDKNNTSGFGKNGKVPMVAVYTGHIENVNQSQHIAYSLDDGITWTKYANNPVLDLHKKDFRDPKIFWYEQKKYWVMALMFPVEHMVQFYSSKNLKVWNHLSDFGPAGDTSGVWECPDLTQVPVEGMPGKKKWVLQMSQNAAMQYFVGEFNGVQFTNENTGAVINRPDYGPDYYAAISYNQLPAAHLPTAIGWLNNWNYANDIPTTPWKGTMSLPRNLSVKKSSTGWLLIQQPIAALKYLRNTQITLNDRSTDGVQVLPVKGKNFEMELSIIPAAHSVTGIRLARGGNHYFEIGYDAAAQLFYTDRSNSGRKDFSADFSKFLRTGKLIPAKNNMLKLHIFYDNSIVEIFVNDGEAVFTSQIFPDEKDDAVEIFSNNATARFTRINFWKLKSIAKE